MERGDISNEVVPRLAIVFENLIGLLPTKPDQAKFTTYRKFHQYKRAVKVFQPNEMLIHRVWDITWRMHWQVEAITYLGEEFVEPIEEWIDREDLPISSVRAYDPNLLAREIAYMPYLAAIFDPDPGHQFTFGAKGRIVGPNDDLVGRL